MEKKAGGGRASWEGSRWEGKIIRKIRDEGREIERGKEEKNKERIYRRGGEGSNRYSRL